MTVPLHSCEHFYVVTDQIDGMHRDLPVLRDPDGYTYFKEEVGGLVVGGFEPDAKPWVSPDDIPYPFEFQLLGEDWEHFAPLMEQAQRRIPALRDTGIKKFYNGPESFTPDNQFIAGEAPGLRNFFVGAGFNSVGIASAGGRRAGRWPNGSCAGDPGLDLTAADIRRFAPFHGNTRFLRDRVGEVLGLHYALPWPNRELATARPLRRSPVHHLVAAAGACFGSRMGWERPNVFAPDGAEPVIEYSWDAPNWLPWSAAEQRAARRDVALFDQTSFSKYLLTGPDSERALQWLCTADVAVAAGPDRVHRAAQRARPLRVRPDRDPPVRRGVPAGQQLGHDRAGPGPHSGGGCRAARTRRLVDVTSAYAVLGVMGPRSRDLLAALSPADLGPAAFPFGTSREIDLGYFRVRATRITYVGELGWELYVPAECAAGVFELLTGGGAGVRAGPRRLLHDRVDAAGKGVPGLRPGADPGVRPGGGGTAVRVQAAWRRPLPRPGSGGEGPGRGPAAAAGFGPGRRPGPGAGPGTGGGPAPGPGMNEGPAPGPAGGRIGAGAVPCCGAASWCCVTGWRSAS